MIKKYSAGFILLLILFGCASNPESNESAGSINGSTAQAGADVITEDGVALPTAGFLPGDSVTTQLFTAYGKPEEISEETRENPQVPSCTDTVRTFYYKEFSYQVLESGYSGDQILLETVIKGKGIELNNHLEVGLDRSAVYELLGFPAMEDDISMIFYLQENENSQAYEYYLQMENNTVTMIVITGYVF